MISITFTSVQLILTHMNPSYLHILTSWLPLYTLIFSGLILSAGLLLKNEKLFNISMLLLAFSALVSFITGVCGGASMPKIKDLPNINHAALHLHAWSSFGAIAFAIVLGVLGVIRFRRKKQFDTITNIMMILISLLLVAFLIMSMQFASRIRL